MPDFKTGFNIVGDDGKVLYAHPPQAQGPVQSSIQNPGGIAGFVNAIFNGPRKLAQIGAESFNQTQYANNNREYVNGVKQNGFNENFMDNYNPMYMNQKDYSNYQKNPWLEFGKGVAGTTALLAPGAGWTGAALSGALGTVGASDKQDFAGLAKDAGKGALMGAGTYGALKGIGYVGGKVINKLGKKGVEDVANKGVVTLDDLTNALSERAKQMSDLGIYSDNQIARALGGSNNIGDINSVLNVLSNQDSLNQLSKVGLKITPEQQKAIAGELIDKLSKDPRANKFMLQQAQALVDGTGSAMSTTGGSITKEMLAGVGKPSNPTTPIGTTGSTPRPGDPLFENGKWNDLRAGNTASPEEFVHQQEVMDGLKANGFEAPTIPSEAEINKIKQASQGAKAGTTNVVDNVPDEVKSFNDTLKQYQNRDLNKYQKAGKQGIWHDLGQHTKPGEMDFEGATNHDINTLEGALHHFGLERDEHGISQLPGKVGDIRAMALDAAPDKTYVFDADKFIDDDITRKMVRRSTNQNPIRPEDVPIIFKDVLAESLPEGNIPGANLDKVLNGTVSLDKYQLAAVKDNNAAAYVKFINKKTANNLTADEMAGAHLWMWANGELNSLSPGYREANNVFQTLYENNDGFRQAFDTGLGGTHSASINNVKGQLVGKIINYGKNRGQEAYGNWLAGVGNNTANKGTQQMVNNVAQNSGGGLLNFMLPKAAGLAGVGMAGMGGGQEQQPQIENIFSQGGAGMSPEQMQGIQKTGDPEFGRWATPQEMMAHGDTPQGMNGMGGGMDSSMQMRQQVAQQKEGVVQYLLQTKAAKSIPDAYQQADMIIENRLLQQGIDPSFLKPQAVKPPSAASLKLQGQGAAGLRALDTIAQNLAQGGNAKVSSHLPGLFQSTNTKIYTNAAKMAAEQFGRLQSGGQISKPEEERFMSMLPTATDDSRSAMAKINTLRQIFTQLLGSTQGQDDGSYQMPQQQMAGLGYQ